jgi:hypothetical protein
LTDYAKRLNEQALGSRDKCELLTMAGPPDLSTVARMDSLMQLQYIIERERSRANGSQCTPADALHITTSSPVIDRLRRMLGLLRLQHIAVRHA